ncbi:MAG: DNA topoisomerase IV subunit B [Pseudomonadota bacterium]
MSDLFQANAAKAAHSNAYDASTIEVLEGLEPVRRRPGMYIGGTDARALHHLAAEILDNAMDEAVAGHADTISITLHAGNRVTVRDNGRGIPVDPHPKFPDKSALEVILTTLHSGGKFNDKAYATSGGLHGVGMSVVNALSDDMQVTIHRQGNTYTQSYSRGLPLAPIRKGPGTKGQTGSAISFHPDTQIFGDDLTFSAKTLYEMARSKAYLHRGLTVDWTWEDATGNEATPTVPKHDVIKFHNGLQDFIETEVEQDARLPIPLFSEVITFSGKHGKIDLACAWLQEPEGWIRTYCNTVPTPQGGTHETGLRNALLKSVRHYADLTNNKKAAIITADDIMAHLACMASVFIPQPQFQGQTKERLTSPEATRLVENATKDAFDHFLTGHPDNANLLLQTMIERAEARERMRDEKAMQRKTATRRLRLPGKLADCARSTALGTEVFLVEGDSAGGSAKQARDRETQAVLPLRGKILNVAAASADKIRNNQEIQDLILALGCGVGRDCKAENLRYERVVIMTDADVDGAHISSLLIAFFYTQMRPLVAAGHLYLAQPPLYRLAVGPTYAYARDDAHKDHLMQTMFKGKTKVEISRFKGLGEMPARQLKDTTMSPLSRTLIRVTLEWAAVVEAELVQEPLTETQATAALDDLVDRLMGKNAEARFNFIQENASFAKDIDI